MRPGKNGELIVEGQTEARVVAHYLTEHSRRGILASFEPPITAGKMGYLAFASSRVEDFYGTSDKKEHVIADPAEAMVAATIIGIAAVPEMPIFKAKFGRRKFLLNSVRQHAAAVIGTNLEGSN